ncbi:hypothetical protein NDU88_011071 [Pleurodeles waltl]|uniref:Uncharacterized protein n=1 Tax=Pleurodeles waltl TaxID=8319 RepID=A0AAV7Q215_PLEWA|nr:hypothetical protein NDU88_011071 [Pleurodeles waltl]
MQCTGLQEQFTGSAYKEYDASAAHWPPGAGYCQCLLKERDASAVHWPAGAGYCQCMQRERDASSVHCSVGAGYLQYIQRERDAVHWPAGAGHCQCIQREHDAYLEEQVTGSQWRFLHEGPAPAAARLPGASWPCSGPAPLPPSPFCSRPQRTDEDGTCLPPAFRFAKKNNIDFELQLLNLSKAATAGRACRERVMQVLCSGPQEQVTGRACRERVMQVLCTGPQEQVTGRACRERVMQVLCSGPQEQVTGRACRERVMQVLCSGPQEQVTGRACRERVMQVLCTGPQEQVTGRACRERVMQVLCSGPQEQVTGRACRERVIIARLHRPHKVDESWGQFAALGRRVKAVAALRIELWQCLSLAFGSGHRPPCPSATPAGPQKQTLPLPRLFLALPRFAS